MNEHGNGGEWALISRVGERLQDALVLIESARGQASPEKASLLSGCACLLLVVALDEELSLIVRGAAEERRRTSSAAAFRPRVASLAELSGSSLPNRILEVPKRLSGGRLRMLPTGHHVRALWELLRVRNKLVHDTPDEVLELGAVSTAEWERQLQEALRDDPWRRVGLEAAERYLEAASLFIAELQEIDFDDEAAYQGGVVLGPTSK